MDAEAALEDGDIGAAAGDEIVKSGKTRRSKLRRPPSGGSLEGEAADRLTKKDDMTGYADEEARARVRGGVTQEVNGVPRKGNEDFEERTVKEEDGIATRRSRRHQLRSSKHSGEDDDDGDDVQFKSSERGGEGSGRARTLRGSGGRSRPRWTEEADEEAGNEEGQQKNSSQRRPYSTTAKHTTPRSGNSVRQHEELDDDDGEVEDAEQEAQGRRTRRERRTVLRFSPPVEEPSTRRRLQARLPA